MNNRCYSSYLWTVFEPKLFKRSTKDIAKILKKIGLDKFDAIAFRGMSGATMAPAVALLVNKPTIMVRKEGDGNHSGLKTEGFKMVERIVIIDDLVSSGNTLRETVETLVSSRKDVDSSSIPPKVMAIILYHSSNDFIVLHSYQLNKATTPILGSVPVYSFMYEKDYNDKSKMKFYCNSLVQKALKSPKPSDGCSYIYVDIP